MPHGGHHQILLRREVVKLSTTAHPGALADNGGGRTSPAKLDQAVHGRFHQTLTHRPRALALRRTRVLRTGLRGHPPSMSPFEQTVKPDCLFGTTDFRGSLVLGDRSVGHQLTDEGLFVRGGILDGRPVELADRTAGKVRRELQRQVALRQRIS